MAENRLYPPNFSLEPVRKRPEVPLNANSFYEKWGASQEVAMKMRPQLTI